MSKGAPFHVKDESHIVLAEFQHLSLCVGADDGGFLVVAPETRHPFTANKAEPVCLDFALG